MEMDRIMERWNAILLEGLPEHEIDCIVSALQELRHRAVDIDVEKALQSAHK
jgi:hypothetical protein